MFPKHLEQWRLDIERSAKRCGLDFNPIVYEMVDGDGMSAVAAYTGYPVRLHHWKFGQEYIKLKSSYRFGLSKIYELVIPTYPCFGYLMDNNDDASQKTIMAHVCGHADFFKNNPHFADIPTNLHNIFANNAELMDDIRREVGKEIVDKFLEACYSLDNLYDPQAPFTLALPTDKEVVKPQTKLNRITPSADLPDYMEDVLNPPEYMAEQRARIEEEAKLLSQIKRGVKIPAEPVRDILAFLLFNAPLESWQQEVVRIVREESLAFKGNVQTKIMNEGWAAYWHSYIMADMGMATDAEIWQFAEMNAGVLAGGAFNPYRLGKRLWEDIKWRWDTGRHGRLWEDCREADILNNWEEFMVFKTLFDKNGGLNENCRREWHDFTTLLYETRNDRGMLRKVLFFPAKYISEWLNFLTAEARLQELKRNSKELWSKMERKIEMKHCLGYIGLKNKLRDGAVKAPEVSIPSSWIEWASAREFNGKLGEGADKMFAVRAVYSDFNFVREFFTEDFCRQHSYHTVGIQKKFNDTTYETEPRYVIESRDYLRVKKFLLDQLLNAGQPKITLYDANFGNNGELRLIHLHDGRNLDVTTIFAVLERLYLVWGKEKPAHLETLILIWPEERHWFESWVPPGEEPPEPEQPKGSWIRFTYDGEEFKGHQLDFEKLEPEIKAILPYIPSEFI